MRFTILQGALWLGALAVCAESVPAHGGQYRGPEDVVPPRSGPRSGPRVPVPKGPKTGSGPRPSVPGPSPIGAPGPITGNRPGPGNQRGPITSGIPIDSLSDLTRWEYWWEFNKDPYLKLKDALRRSKPVTTVDDIFIGGGRRERSQDLLLPTASQIDRDVLPALKRALDATQQRDITSSCLVAMAKIGRNHDSFELVPVFAEHLNSPDQEVRETAALALGISQLPAALETLEHLARDDQKGRALTNRAEVDDRTRSFATYGLGLLAWASADIELKRRALKVFAEALSDEVNPSRNLKVAAISGIGLLRPDRHSSDPREQALLTDCVDALTAYYQRPLGAGHQLLQSHVPTALARLLGRDGPGVNELKQTLAEELRGKRGGKRRSRELTQSAALALGQLCRPTPEDQQYCDALWQYHRSGRDHQARYFSLMALGQIGGLDNRDRLLRVLTRGRTLEQPWAAIALGVWSHARLLDQRPGGGAEVATVGRALRTTVREAKNPDVLAASAVALGLCKHLEAADDLRALLTRRRHQQELAGSLCIGLSLMGDRRSLEELRHTVATSVRRPDLLRQAAVALGILGDRQAADQLNGLLKEGESNLAKLSAVASALGFIGDRRSIQPLTDMLFDPELTDLSRAFAAVALGGIADKELLPWNSKLASGINYRAATETLSNFSAGTGILDLL